MSIYQSVFVNFQPTANSLAGYKIDSGAGLALTTSTSDYGWIEEEDRALSTGWTALTLSTPSGQTGRVGDDNGNNAQAQDTHTYVRMQSGTAPAAAWQHEVANGRYAVIVSVGVNGTSNLSSYRHRINVEGQELIHDYSPTLISNYNAPASTFSPYLVAPYQVRSGVFNVTDGLLTIDAYGGQNTVINYVKFFRLAEESAAVANEEPQVTNIVFSAHDTSDGQGTVEKANDGTALQDLGASIVFKLNLVSEYTNSAIDGASLDGHVRLINTKTGDEVAGSVNTSAGGDTITFTPRALLLPFTEYTVEAIGVMDSGGRELAPFAATFFTDEGLGTAPIPFQFERVTADDGLFGSGAAPSTNEPHSYSSIAVSPDSKYLYAVTTAIAMDAGSTSRADDFISGGQIYRWNINADGTLSNKYVLNDFGTGQNPFYTNGTNGQTLTGGDSDARAIIGIAFDPHDKNVIWLATNEALNYTTESSKTFAPDFTGKIVKLTLVTDAAGNITSHTVEDYVVGLPRSAKDHMTNSLAFGPDGFLYLTQGSNTATGAADPTWGSRAERDLTSAVLRIDTTRSGVIDVQTENYGPSNYAGNTIWDAAVSKPAGWTPYDPYAANAPVTVYAEGLRNAYDLVWHSNGNLYSATNGSAPGGWIPNVPSTPANEATYANGPTMGNQPDLMFRIVAGDYYGHPNAEQGNYVLNGGNPTGPTSTSDDGKDPFEVVASGNFAGYGVGTNPDANYHPENIYAVGYNRSPDGMMEYRSNAFGGGLQGELLVAEFSAGKDIIAIRTDSSGRITSQFVVDRTPAFSNPLDLAENARNGFIYVAEYGTEASPYDNQLVLLKPPSGKAATVEYTFLQAEAATGVGTTTIQPATIGAWKTTTDGTPDAAYVDFNGVGATESLDWLYNVSESGLYELSWAYALGVPVERDLNLVIGTQTIGVLDFAPTASWTDWKLLTTQVHLNAGENHIKLQEIGSTSGANFDYMAIKKVQADIPRIDAGTSGEPGYYAGVGPTGNATATATSTRSVGVNIGNTEDDAIYQTGRYASGTNDLKYEIPVADGRYLVKLLFNEPYWGTPQGGSILPGNDQREFDLWVEGELKKDNLDIHQEAGGANKALSFEYLIDVDDGALSILLEDVGKDNPIIQGIEVTAQPQLYYAGGATTAANDVIVDLYDYVAYQASVFGKVA